MSSAVGLEFFYHCKFNEQEGPLDISLVIFLVNKIKVFLQTDDTGDNEEPVVMIALFIRK